MQLVEGAPGIEDKLPAEAYAKVKKIVDEVYAAYDGDADIVVADARYSFVNRITQKALIRHGEMSNTMTDKIDRVVLNRWLGLPIFLAIMYVMFLFTQNLGGAFIDFFDITFAASLSTVSVACLRQSARPNGLRSCSPTVSAAVLQRFRPLFRRSSSCSCSSPCLRTRVTWLVPRS